MSTQGAPAIAPVRLLVAVAFVAIAMLVARRERLGLARDLAWGSLRAAAQLVAVGYALRLLIDGDHPLLVGLALATMIVVGGLTSARRVQVAGPRGPLVLYALASVSAAAAVALVPVFLLVVRPAPWYDPRTVIPLAGMMIANAMNVVAQVLERIVASARARRDVLEASLALGATVKQALAPITREAVRGALLPTINGLLTVGLVALPGMMTGQILGGGSPEEAVRYQLVVMYQIVVVAAVAGALSAVFARRLLFTSDARLAHARSAQRANGEET